MEARGDGGCRWWRLQVMEAAKDVPYCPASQGLLSCKLHPNFHVLVEEKINILSYLTLSFWYGEWVLGISVQPYVITKRTNHSRPVSFIYPTFAPIATPPPPKCTHCNWIHLASARFAAQNFLKFHCFTSFWLHNCKKCEGFTRHLCIYNYGETDRLRW